MFHNSTAVLAISKEPNETKFQKTLGVNDFYFGMPGFEYPMGNIQMVGKSTAPMFRGEKPIETKLAPEFSLDEVAKHAVDFWLSTEDLPSPDNRVTLARDGNITLTYTYNNQEPKKQLYNKLKSMLGTSACTPTTCCRERRTSRTTSRSRASPTRRGRSGSGRIRRRPCSTPTARPTSSTTCTSSTRASSRASAR
jgi:hypothetical protein